MKIIFLDIDGVLNSEETLRKRDKHLEKTGEIISEVDEEKVELLRQIVERTNAKIVLTSTWRNKWEKQGQEYVPIQNESKKADDVFKKHGIEIHSITPSINGDRPGEIKTWINEHGRIEKNRFVSLDDDFFKFHYALYGIQNCLIKTSFYDGGLQKEHVDRAVKILNGE